MLQKSVKDGELIVDWGAGSHARLWYSEETFIWLSIVMGECPLQIRYVVL